MHRLIYLGIISTCMFHLVKVRIFLPDFEKSKNYRKLLEKCVIPIKETKYDSEWR